jgi:succinate dehydrogenase (ubiquinone) cytochrome b560 subunit
MAAFLGNSPVGPILKFAVAFPLVYHYLGGVRHIVWDKTPESLTNEQVQQASVALIGAATVVSAGITVL